LGRAGRGKRRRRRGGRSPKIVVREKGSEKKRGKLKKTAAGPAHAWHGGGGLGGKKKGGGEGEGRGAGWNTARDLTGQGKKYKEDRTGVGGRNVAALTVNLQTEKEAVGNLGKEKNRRTLGVLQIT